VGITVTDVGAERKASTFCNMKSLMTIQKNYERGEMPESPSTREHGCSWWRHT
jgi:hypothetical protein